MTARDITLAVIATFIWGLTFPATAWALQETTPIFFVALRFSIVAAFAFFIPRPDVPWRILIALGLLLEAGQFGFMFTAMAFAMPAGMASLLVHCQALLIVLYAVVYGREVIHRHHLLALALISLGLATLLGNAWAGSGLLALALMALAAIVAAAGNTILRTCNAKAMTAIVIWMSVVVPLPLLLASFVFEGGGSVTPLVHDITWVTVAAALYSALLATILSFTILGRLLATYPAAEIAPFFLLVPVFGLSLSALLLDERLSTGQIFGSALIFLGLCVATMLGRSRSGNKN